MTDPAFPFRTIDELALRCGHYCWLENRLFGLTGRWASDPGPGSETAGRAVDPTVAEVRVLLSEMSSWHGFLAGQWRDRLPVRAGVDAGALVVAPPGGVAEALDLLETVPSFALRLGGLVDPVLTGLLAAYDDEAGRASPVSERPVLGLLELARGQGRTELATASARADRAAIRHPEADAAAGPGSVDLSELRARLQRRLGAGRGIFPAARAS
jgi:hypothetical protein